MIRPRKLLVATALTVVFWLGWACLALAEAFDD